MKVVHPGATPSGLPASSGSGLRRAIVLVVTPQTRFLPILGHLLIIQESPIPAAVLLQEGAATQVFVATQS